MVLIKLLYSVVPIHPHHTINAGGCQIASFKQRDCNKALTLIRTNVVQKKQIKAKLSLVETLCGGSRKVEQGVYSYVWELLMLTR